MVDPTSRRQTRARFRPDAALVIGGLLVTVMCILAVIGPWIGPHSAVDASGPATQAPSGTHWFGTDSVGLDVFSRVIAAPRVDLTIAVGAALGALILGAPLGAMSGYGRGFWSEAIMRLSDLIHSFPVFILAMAAIVITGPKVASLILVIAFVNAPIYVRVMRAEVLSVRDRTYVEAAIALNESSGRIMVRHIVPNALASIVAQLSVTIGISMLLTAGLSFIGAGLRAPTPEWGLMIAGGAGNVMLGQWWPTVFPGLTLSLSVLGFSLLGESLARVTDPLRRLS
jgi:peptide/nickel transport system permease protein